MPGFCVRLFLEELLRYDDLYCAVQYAEFERGCSEQFAVDLQQHVGRRGYRYAASLHMPDVPDLVYFAVEEFAQAEYYVPPVERAYERQVEQAVVRIITDNQHNGKATGLGEVGSRLLKRFPDFDVRNYGFKKLRPFLKSLGAYEFDEPSADNGQRQIYLRVRE